MTHPAFAENSKHNLYLTPTGARWLNPVERLFAEMTLCCLRRGSSTAVHELEKALLGYLDQRHKVVKPFECKAVEGMLAKVARLWKRISNPRHE